MTRTTCVLRVLAVAALSGALAACSVIPDGARSYGAPEAVVPPSAFKGVHGLAIDSQGRLLAGSVTGNTIEEVSEGRARVFIGPPQGQADDIAVGPRGELAWTSFIQGVVHYRESDGAPIRVLASGLPGINSIAFDQANGRLYASQVFLGDAVWEIDRGGGKPRLIARDLGGFNGFEVRDGALYGPLWFKGQVARLDPATGALRTIASGFKVPAAVNFDSKGNLWVVDTALGQLVRVDPASGAKTVVAQLTPALDNLAIDSRDRIFVSNMADSSIQQVDPASGEVRDLIRGGLAVPGGIKLAEDGRTVYVADVFTLRGVDTASGAITEIRRMQASDLEYPFSVGLSGKRLLLASWFTNSVQVLDRRTMATVAMLHGFKAPVDALELPDGSLLVAEAGGGRLTRASGDGWAVRSTVLEGLQGPAQMILGSDGMVWLTESAGRLLRIDPRDWRVDTVAQGLDRPEGLAQSRGGRLVIAETGARRLIELDPATGERRTLADQLPIGFEPTAGLPPVNIPTGVAVADDGTIYFTADRDSGLYRLRPR